MHFRNIPVFSWPTDVNPHMGQSRQKCLPSAGFEPATFGLLDFPTLRASKKVPRGHPKKRNMQSGAQFSCAFSGSERFSGTPCVFSGDRIFDLRSRKKRLFWPLFVQKCIWKDLKYVFLHNFWCSFEWYHTWLPNRKKNFGDPMMKWWWNTFFKNLKFCHKSCHPQCTSPKKFPITLSYCATCTNRVRRSYRERVLNSVRTYSSSLRDSGVYLDCIFCYSWSIENIVQQCARFCNDLSF